MSNTCTQMRSYLFEFTSGNYSWHIQMSNGRDSDCHLLLLLALARWVAAPAGLRFLTTPQQAQQTFGMNWQMLLVVSSCNCMLPLGAHASWLRLVVHPVAATHMRC